MTYTTGGNGTDINVYSGGIAMPITCNASLSTNYTSGGTAYVAQAATSQRFTVRGAGAAGNRQRSGLKAGSHAMPQVLTHKHCRLAVAMGIE